MRIVKLLSARAAGLNSIVRLGESGSLALRPGPKESTMLVLLLLFAWCWLVDFSMILQHGFMADDWGKISHHYFEAEHLQKYDIPYSVAVAIKAARFDGRPLLAGSALVEWHVYEVGGRVGWGILAALVLALNAFLLFLICRVRLGFLPAVLAAVFALSFPGDTTHQWLTLAAGRLSYTLGLLACISFAKRFNVLTGILLLLSMLLYEPAVLMFVLAPFASAIGGWRELKRAGKIAAWSIGAWLLLRVAMYWLGERGHGGNNLAAIYELVRDPAEMLSYLLGFLRAVWLGLFHWPVEAMRFLDYAQHLAVAVSAVVIFACAHFMNRKVPSVETGDMVGGTMAAGEHTGLTWERSPSAILLACGGGLALMLASAAPSFVIGPSEVWGIYSRGNYVLGFGVGVTLGALVALGLQYSKHRWLASASIALAFALITLWGLARFEIQQIFVHEIKRERHSIARMLSLIGEMPDNTVVVAARRQPAGQHMVRPLEILQGWELNGIFRAVYGPGVTVVESGAFGNEQCETPCSVLNFDQDQMKVSWDRRLVGGRVLVPHPVVLEYLNEE